jgi:hypothetical protein
MAFAVVVTLAVVASACVVTCIAVRDRRRRRRSSRGVVALPGHSLEEKEVNEPADCVQVWLDHEWQRKFGQGPTDNAGGTGRTDNSDSVEG